LLKFSFFQVLSKHTNSPVVASKHDCIVHGIE